MVVNHGVAARLLYSSFDRQSIPFVLRSTLFGVFHRVEDLTGFDVAESFPRLRLDVLVVIPRADAHLQGVDVCAGFLNEPVELAVCLLLAT